MVLAEVREVEIFIGTLKIAPTVGRFELTTEKV
jgi:hypothetical protein